MNYTFLKIEQLDGRYIVPDLARQYEPRSFTTQLEALFYAEALCEKFNDEHDSVHVYALLDSTLTTNKNCRVDLGPKARLKIGMMGDAPILNQVIYNIMSFPCDGILIWFGRVCIKGEWFTVTSDSRSNVDVRRIVNWSNTHVSSHREKAGYPVNPFLPEDRQEKSGQLLPIPTERFQAKPQKFTIDGSKWQVWDDPRCDQIFRPQYQVNAEEGYVDFYQYPYSELERGFLSSPPRPIPVEPLGVPPIDLMTPLNARDLHETFVRIGEQLRQRLNRKNNPTDEENHDKNPD